MVIGLATNTYQYYEVEIENAACSLGGTSMSSCNMDLLQFCTSPCPASSFSQLVISWCCNQEGRQQNACPWRIDSDCQLEDSVDFPQFPLILQGHSNKQIHSNGNSRSPFPCGGSDAKALEGVGEMIWGTPKVSWSVPSSSSSSSSSSLSSSSSSHFLYIKALNLSQIYFSLIIIISNCWWLDISQRPLSMDWW